MKIYLDYSSRTNDHYIENQVAIHVARVSETKLIE